MRLKIWRSLLLVIIIGIAIGLGSGLVENRMGSAGISENKYYGFPLRWRISNMNTGETYLYSELFLDCLFGIAVTTVIAALVVISARFSKK